LVLCFLGKKVTRPGGGVKESEKDWREVENARVGKGAFVKILGKAKAPTGPIQKKGREMLQHGGLERFYSPAERGDGHIRSHTEAPGVNYRENSLMNSRVAKNASGERAPLMKGEHSFWQGWRHCMNREILTDVALVEAKRCMGTSSDSMVGILSREA